MTALDEQRRAEVLALWQKNGGTITVGAATIPLYGLDAFVRDLLLDAAPRSERRVIELERRANAIRDIIEGRPRPRSGPAGSPTPTA